MKVILTGATGFIGGEVLHQCLQNPSITSLVTLSRRNLPNIAAKNPKLKVVVLKDFMNYSDDVLQDLAGAEACIWSLGGTADKFSNYEENHKVSVDYTMTAADVFIKSLAPQLDKGRRFRFVYLSGMVSVRDLGSRCWFWEDTRKIKGEVENGLVERGEQHRATIETYMVKPGGVLTKEDTLFTRMMVVNKSRCIRVNELAAAMMDTALNGGKIQIMENDVLVSRGRSLLKIIYP